MEISFSEIEDNHMPFEINSNITSYPKANLVRSRLDCWSFGIELSQPFPIIWTPLGCLWLSISRRIGSSWFAYEEFIHTIAMSDIIVSMFFYHVSPTFPTFVSIYLELKQWKSLSWDTVAGLPLQNSTCGIPPSLGHFLHWDLNDNPIHSFHILILHISLKGWFNQGK